jgi:signal transduction histidine kinase
MKFLPRTLFGQIVMALFVGLIAVQAAGFWLMLDERTRLGERLIGGYAAQRIAGIIAILDEAEPEERTRLIRALNVPPAYLTLDVPWQKSTENETDEARLFMDRIQKEFTQPLTMQLLSIKRAENRRRDDPMNARMPKTETVLPENRGHRPNRRDHGGSPLLFVAGQVRLSDATVLTFRHSLPQQNLDWPLRLQGLLTVLGISVALLAGWAVRRLTRPLAALADAASGLAGNLEQPPLPETGPLEVLHAARAFNTMQRDLKRYLETRAHALAGVSHDLRLPITRLRLRLESLPEGALKSRMEDDLTEMDDMIGHTLEFLRAGTLTEKRVRTNLNALLESVAEDMISLGAQIMLHGQIAEPVFAHPQALRRCLVNLLDNARRYSNGTIDMCVAEKPALLEIRIEDRGEGIPAAELERVFEPYVRIESSRARHTGGSGLGLAIARAIARAHEGDLRLESRSGGGISAILILPRKN